MMPRSQAVGDQAQPSDQSASGVRDDVAAWSALAAPGPSLPVLQGQVEAEVAVVGLGGSGLSALLELCARGVEAVGIDSSGVGSGAAGRNGGFLLAGLAAFHHDAVVRWGRGRACRCYRATMGALDEICRDTPAAVRRTGSLRIASSAAELEDCRSQLRAMEADGLPAEWWGGQEGSGLRFPTDASFQPVERCNALAARLLSAGVRLFGGSPVTAIGPRSVTSPGGSLQCRSVLVCVDGGLEVVLPELAGTARSARLQMIGTRPVAAQVAPSPVYSRFGLDYWQQLPTGELLLGGARDCGGEAEWTTARRVTEPVQAALESLLERVIRPVPPQIAWRWAGIVSYTGSGLPVVRRLPTGVFAAGGYSGTGNVVGMLAGRALVELALDGGSTLAEMFDCPEGPRM